MIMRYFESFWPQFPQNFVPGGFLVLHFEHVISVCLVAFGSGFPQFPQNFVFAGFSALHLGQMTGGVGIMLFPQFPQNFIPDTFLAPHFWQTTTS